MPTTQRVDTENEPLALLNRELSALDLMTRVLEVAADRDEPLLERVRFCGIVSSILDEFFMVRVAGLLDQVASGLSVRSADGRTPQQTLIEVRERATQLTTSQSRLWRDELCPALAREGILVGSVEDASEEELGELRSVFASQIYPVLTPLAVGPGQPFPYISGLSLSLGVTVRDPESGEERFARVKVPEGLPRFVGVGTRGLLIPLESTIAHFLAWLFPEMEITERTAFRLTRDGDLRHLRRRRRPARGGRVGAAQAPLRRRRAARGLELDLARHARPPAGAACSRRRTASTRSAACSTWPMSASCTRSTGPI